MPPLDCDVCVPKIVPAEPVVWFTEPEAVWLLVVPGVGLGKDTLGNVVAVVVLELEDEMPGVVLIEPLVLPVVLIDPLVPVEPLMDPDVFWFVEAPEVGVWVPNPVELLDDADVFGAEVGAVAVLEVPNCPLV